MNKEDQSLISELQRMVDIEQNLRRQNPVDWDRTNEVDKANTKRLKEIIKEHGWINISNFGETAALNCWLLAQHADLDPKFQRQCLDLMKALPANEYRASHLALLTDRVMLAEDGVQKYGTQYRGRDDGKYVVLAPLLDVTNLDKYRREVSMKPIAVALSEYGKPAFLTDVELEKYKQSIKTQ